MSVDESRAALDALLGEAAKLGVVKSKPDDPTFSQDEAIVTALLRALENPNELPAAPRDADEHSIAERRQEVHPCHMCGRVANFAALANHETWGEPRWLDLCGKDFVRTAQIMKDWERLREAQKLS